MKKEKAMKILEALPVGNYAVDLFYKYGWENSYLRSTELFEVEDNLGSICFLCDWDEGQDEVCIGRIINIDAAMKEEPYIISIDDLIKKAGV